MNATRLGLFLALAVLAGCTMTDRITVGQYQVEIVDRVSWWGATITATNTCELTRRDAEGACLASQSVGPALSQMPGIGLPILSSLTGAGSMLGSAAIISSGLRNIPASQTNVNQSASQEANPTITPTSTINIRTGGWGHGGH